MNEKAKQLYNILEYAFRLKEYQRDYQKGGPQETYCNLYSRGILNCHAARYWVRNYAPLEYNYDITSMNPGKFLVEIMRATGVDTAYNNVKRMAKSGIDTGLTHDIPLPPQAQNYPIEINEVMAYNYANQGIPIWVTSKMLPPVGHEAIICPSDEPYDEKRGNRIAQAGWVNGFFWMSQIFGTIWRDPNSDIKYYLFPLEVKNGSS